MPSIPIDDEPVVSFERSAGIHTTLHSQEKGMQNKFRYRAAGALSSFVFGVALACVSFPGDLVYALIAGLSSAALNWCWSGIRLG
jgi:hypothetical protein